MSVAPVIARELRAQSRLPFTYGLRLLGAAGLLVVCVIFATEARGFEPNMGGILFGYLNSVLFLSISGMAPLLAADCLSRERREGTLGLLFLTPLKARDIVVAKGLVHGLRALTLWLAVLPILTLPFLQGGVSWKEVAMSVLFNFSAICCGLAAGLMASSIARTWLRAQIFACLFGACFTILFFVSVGAVLINLMTTLVWFPGAPGSGGLQIPIEQALPAGFFGVTDFSGTWGDLLRRPGSIGSQLFLAAGLAALVSIMLLSGVIRLAAWRLRRSWQDEPKSARREWIESKLFTPVIWVAFLRRWSRHKLERNPIGWLEQRTWSGRLVTWTWFAIIISLYSAALSGPSIYRALDSLQSLMSWLLLGSIASGAAGSFQRERESGVMELLLVSPMTVGQIIGGRLRGIWGQFLLAVGLQVGVWLYFGSFIPDQARNYDMLRFFVGSVIALPVIGLYFSLRRRNFINAWLSTMVAGVLMPFAIRAGLVFLVKMFMGGNLHTSDGSFRQATSSYYFFEVLLQRVTTNSLATVIQLMMAAYFGRRLYRDMERRNFQFSRVIN